MAYRRWGSEEKVLLGRGRDEKIVSMCVSVRKDTGNDQTQERNGAHTKVSPCVALLASSWFCLPNALLSMSAWFLLRSVSVAFP